MVGGKKDGSIHFTGSPGVTECLSSAWVPSEAPVDIQAVPAVPKEPWQMRSAYSLQVDSLKGLFSTGEAPAPDRNQLCRPSRDLRHELIIIGFHSRDLELGGDLPIHQR